LSNKLNELGTPLKSEREWKPILVLSITVTICYFVTLRFIFPGYFNPVYPWHFDNYGYYNMANWPMTWEKLIHSSRFVVLIITSILGLFNFKLFAVGLILISLVGILLTIILVRQITGSPYVWPVIIVYLINVFSHPYFYFNYAYDIYDSVSYIFLITILISWNVYNRSENKMMLLLISFLTFLCLLSKETYAPSLLLFWSYQMIFSKRRREAVGLFITTIVVLVFSVYHSKVISKSPFINTSAGESDAYYISYDFTSIIHIFMIYLRDWSNIYVFLIIALILIFAIRKKLFWKEILLFVGMGLATYLPYCLLPNHIFPMYTWLSVPLSYCAILFVQPLLTRMPLDGFSIKGRRLQKKLAVVLFTLLLLLLSYGGLKVYYAHEYPGTSYNLLQEEINRNILNNFENIKKNVQPGDKVLITGLTSPYHPFLNGEFITGYFNRALLIEWTIAVVEESRVTSEENYARKIVPPEKFQDYDKVIAFDGLGRLMKIYNKQAIIHLKTSEATSEITDMEAMQFTGLAELRSNIKQNPNDSLSLMKAGVIYQEAGKINKSEYFLQRAVEIEKNSAIPNPYPFFYLGKVYEQKNQMAEALEMYSKSIEYDTSNNPFFMKAKQRAEEQLKSK